ncbi:MAG TPA: hypothetical protein P5230_00620 [Candidatus Magasanikbacteria bacterium]|nr:hypothetical protein [Candidatus Magasanikbacteria bacterium]
MGKTVDPMNFELTPYLDMRYIVIQKEGSKRTVVPLLTVPTLIGEEGSPIDPSKIKRLKKEGPVVIMRDPFAGKDVSNLLAFPEIKLQFEENMLQSIKRKKISNEELKILQETPLIKEGEKVHKLITESFREFIDLFKIVKETQDDVDGLFS